MASSFPGSIDSFTNPLAASALNSPSHAGQHQDLNDAVNKIETYMGLVKVIPTSVVGGSLSATGTITATVGASTLSVNGCFSALYSNYVIVFDTGFSAATNLIVRLRAAGVDDTNAWYGSCSRTQANATTTTVTGFNGNTSWVVTDAVSQTMQGSLTMFRPFATANCTATMAINGLGTTSFQYVGGTYHGSTASFDGFSFYPNGATLTASTLRVYGYRN